MTHEHGPARSRVVVDIETAGYPFETLDGQQQDYLLRFADSPEAIEEEKKKINLYPLTAEVVCIGMLNADTGKARVLMQAPEGTPSWTDADGAVTYLPGDERAILMQFWEWIPRFGQMISFNGRAFDGPFLHVRSAMLGIRATRNLVPYRYDASRHCDLLEQFTYYNTTRRFSLDFFCLAFGIESPKRQGVTGLDINALHAEGRYREIAEYNHRDLLATRALYERWRDCIAIPQD
jgi:3'-5' exonuclease